jgi:hypothetical protein
MSTEWVLTSTNVAIVACDTGEFWFFPVEDFRYISPLAEPMTGSGTRKSTAALLDGAIALGFGTYDPYLNHAASLPKYVFDLVGSYHITHRTPGHFERAARRFKELERPDLASYLEVHAREETGHDRLVLKDLRALGLPADRIVMNFVPDGFKPLCELFDRLCSSEYPVGCIGYSYCFERTAAMKQKVDVEALEALCPKGVHASRFLRTHSGLGSEVGHVEEMIDFVAGLPASDRIQIVQATYDTAVLMADSLRYRAVSDSVILEKIQAAAEHEIYLHA